MSSNSVRDPLDVAADLDAERYQALTLLIVQASLVIVGMNVLLPKGLTLDFVVVLILLPLWSVSLRAYAGGRLIALLGLAAAVSGVVLKYASAVDHAASSTNALSAVVRLLGGVGTVGLLLWARQLLPLHRVAALYGAGMLASALTSSASYTSLGWKYAFATPVAIIVLALVGVARSRLIAPAAAITLGVIGVANEARSYFGFCILTASLMLWQTRRRPVGRKPNKWAPALLLAGIAASIYYLTTALLTGGYLGAALQQRSVAAAPTTVLRAPLRST